MIKEIVVVSIVALTLLSVDGKSAVKLSSDEKFTLTGDFERDLESYLQAYHPSYVRSLDEDYEKRVKTFRKVYDDIITHDPVASGYYLGFSHLSFLTEEELDSMKNKKMAQHYQKVAGSLKHEVKTDVSALPTSFSWVDQDKVTVVKNQGLCGSCYTYAAAAALETAIGIKCGLSNSKGNLQSVSTKQYIDCSYGYYFMTYTSGSNRWDAWFTGSAYYGNDGCDGGFPRACYAYNNMTQNMENEYSDYSYNPKDKTVTNNNCAYVSHAMLQKSLPVTGYVVVPNDENSMMDALYNNGALACAMNADTISSYKSGVFSGSCGTSPNHAITIVGYGVDGTTPYWLIKNSWNYTWGEQGYIRLKRGCNQCNIIADCVYPLVGGSC